MPTRVHKGCLCIYEMHHVTSHLREARHGKPKNAPEESSELFLGINVESTAVIVIVDLLALLLIAAVLLTRQGRI